MRVPRKGVLAALLLVCSPGIVFAVFELFLFRVPVKGRTRVMAWAFLAVALVLVVGLVVLLARDALGRVRRRGVKVP